MERTKLERMFRLTDHQYRRCRLNAIDCAPYYKRELGDKVRTLDEVQYNIHRGKVGENGFRNIMRRLGIRCSHVDYITRISNGTYGDSGDFVVNGFLIQVKSCYCNGGWLLIPVENFYVRKYHAYVATHVYDDLRGGRVIGFATYDEIVKNTDTLRIEKGECLPDSDTPMKMPCFARPWAILHNYDEEWRKLLNVIS